MSRALYFGLSGQGHLNPSIGLVKELVGRGEEIIYYGGDENQAKILKSGAQFRSLGFKKSRQDKREIQALLNPLERENRLLRYVARTLPMVLNQVKEEKIDYIIFDTQFVLGKMIAEQLRLPSISFCTTLAFSEKVRERIQGRRLEFTPDPALLEERRRLRESIQNQYRFSFPESIMFNTGDITLVCTSDYFQPDDGSFPDTFKFIGPSIVDRYDTGDFPIDKLKDRRVIYISMGTVVNEQPELYSHCLKAFADLEAWVVLSIGQKLNPEDLGPIPANFIVGNHVPQLEVLQHTDVFITHGGMNSTMEALYNNVPLVLNPIGADQPVVAKRVERLGAGLILDKSELNPFGLRKAVNAILEDEKYAVNASKIGDSLRRTGGYRQGADEIFALKKLKSIL
ncbi:glycosyltransferase [Pullulanibacillus sp. KACC 23026]|uniref:macrolide family glycosyltransferase n=1 Tax=Pullulanibacillus sp. KACC 23026 TaxID=3028315 RepID=UPI0023B05D30|nr:macrolide family glycosyltransferase [Pullulanibacillus sp. KACC 23026]WEG13252.1 glycosyltransferase [Pullulanibacillus sp. KACC 23026]